MDSIVFGPVYWLRKNLVEPLKGEPYPWYHRRFNRVPGIEDCYTEDVVCRFVSTHPTEQLLLLVLSGKRRMSSSSGTGWWRRRSCTS